MRKILLLLLFMLLFTACGAAEPTESTDEPPKEEAKPTEETQTAVENTAPSISADAITPAETAAEAGVIRDRDWTKGADDPLITIIEYGDFQ